MTVDSHKILNMFTEVYNKHSNFWLSEVMLNLRCVTQRLLSNVA